MDFFEIMFYIWNDFVFVDNDISFFLVEVCKIIDIKSRV